MSNNFLINRDPESNSCCRYLWKEASRTTCIEAQVNPWKGMRSWKDTLPSGWAIFCMAVGAIMIGIEILKPSTVVAMSILLTSMRMRGRNLTPVKEKYAYRRTPRTYYKSIKQAKNLIQRSKQFLKAVRANENTRAHKILENAFRFSWRVHWSSAPDT